MKYLIATAFASFVFLAGIQAQAKMPFELRLHENLAYLNQSDDLSVDSLQRLNLILPKMEAPYPLLIWIGGGAWSYVDRHQETGIAKQFAQRGIGVASVGHRLSPATWRNPEWSSGIQHPKHIEDVAAAVHWLVEHAQEYGYDSEQLFIGGYSSGAHLAALISMDSTYLASYQLSPSVFKGVIPISGTYDVVDYHQVFLNGSRPELAQLHVEAVFGDTQEQLIAASPVQYMEGLQQPTLLMCDNNLHNYTRLFEDKIRETDFQQVQVVYSYEFSHAELWRHLAEAKSKYRNIIIDFIEEQVARG
ncbi:MAG: alpha/beta hydrolase [Bacteroidota bacterium]